MPNPTTTPEQVIATPAVVALVGELRAECGDVLWHQSGGCRGGMFSLENGRGVRFLVRSRLFADAQIDLLREQGRLG